MISIEAMNGAHYWREGKDEVDFVLKRGRKIWAVEVFIDESNYFNFEKDPMAFLESFTQTK